MTGSWPTKRAAARDQTATRTEIAELRREVHADIGELRGDLHALTERVARIAVR